MKIKLIPIQAMSMFVMLIFSFSLLSAQKYDLKFNLEEGKTYKIQQKADQEINITVMGMSQDIKQINVFDYHYFVKEVKDGIQTIEVTYDAIQSSREGAQGSSSYNSRTDTVADNPESQYLAAIIGESFTMKMDQMGKVLEVIGTEALLEKGLSQMEGIDEQTMAAVKVQINSQFGDEAMKSSMGQISAFFPGKKVKVGKSWKSKVATTTVMPLNMSNVYTLDKVEDGKAYLSVRTEITPGEGEPLEMGPMTMTYELAGVQNGTVVLDLATGWTLKGDMDQDLGGNVQIDNPMTGVLDAPMTIKSTITFRPGK
jgi:hypothetical protein